MSQLYINNKKNIFPFLYICFGILFLSAYSFLLNNQIDVFGENITQHDTLALDDYNIVAVGDFSCSEDAKNTVMNIKKTDPEIVLGLGDYSYEKSATCWKDIVGGIDPQKMKISFGNHEFEDKSLVKQYMDYTNLDKQYYSFDYKNVHFISMATEIPYEQGSEQFEFVHNDLMKTKTNPSIDWIIVYFHQPMYTSPTHHEGLEDLRDLYHGLFNEYGVDLVLQGHIHNYQRTYPLIYNSENPSNPIITQSPIIHNVDNRDRNIYVNPEGTLFAIVGTGGRELHGLDGQAYFTASQLEEFGFLDLKMINNGKGLVGQFYSNDGNIIKDQFVIDKSISSPSVDKTVDDSIPPDTSLAICDKLTTFGKDLMAQWKAGQITNEEALLLGERGLKLMTESGCGGGN